MQPGPPLPPQPQMPPGYAPGAFPPPVPPMGVPMTYGPPPPPKPGMSTGLIVAIVLIVVLALIMVPAVLYVMVTGLNSTPGGVSRPTVSLSAGVWQGTTTMVTITSVSTTTLTTALLTYQVVAGNGTIYFSGPAGAGLAVNGVVVTVTYHDASSDGQLGPDDNIQVSVAQNSDLLQIHGTQFKILEGSDVLGTCVLP